MEVECVKKKKTSSSVEKSVRSGKNLKDKG